MSSIENVNIGIYSSRLDIFYSDTLINSVSGVYRTGSTYEDEKDSDIAESTVTISADLKSSTDGKVRISRYVGNLLFPNIQLASVSQYVYTCKLNVTLSYGEYNETSLSRANTDGNNIGTTDEQNLKNVQYRPCLLYTSPSPRD